MAASSNCFTPTSLLSIAWHPHVGAALLQMQYSLALLFLPGVASEPQEESGRS